MSDKVLGIGLSLVALAIPVVGPALSLSLLATTALTLGVAITANFLIGPAKPRGLATGPVDRLHANLDVLAPRKIVFGHTAMATDVRYQAFTGGSQEYIEQIVCVASHEVQSIDELWLDAELAWSLAGGVAAKFAGYLTVSPRTLGTSANGIAIDGTWTASCTLTGCAYLHIKYKLVDGGGTTNDSPFASGVTGRMTIRGKGAKTYDPALDSSVPGGAGAHRADDQASWTWDANRSRNPALQELWYELGWRINGKLAVGKGLPPARIDLPSYITAANMCDETVTKSAANGGGTEPRYRSDGVVSERDDPGAVRDNLSATMNAVVRDDGGRIALHVYHNDLATPVTPAGKAAFDEDDALGDIDWDPTPDLKDSFNIVRGTRIDPSNEALYQPVEFPDVAIASLDGIDRADPVDYPFVQSNGQAQRLAKQRLQRNQYQGRISFTAKPSFWAVSLGDVVPMSLSQFGWSAKLFRIAGQKISRTGATEIVAIEENAAIYQWDNDEAAAVTPGEPVIYDSTNDPMQSGMNSALGQITNIASDSILDRSEKALLVQRLGQIIAENPGIVAQATTHGLTAEKAAYEAAYDALGAYLVALAPAWDDTTQDTAIVRATFNAKFNDYYEARQDLLNMLDDTARQTGVVIDPVSQAVVYADAGGAAKIGELPKDVPVTASIGTSDITADGAWSRTATSGITCTIGPSTGILNITALSVVEVQVPVTFTINGITRTANVKVVRQDDPPTNGGGGGGAGSIANTTTLGQTTGTAYDTTNAVSATLTVTAGAAGKVQGRTGELGFKRNTASEGDTSAAGKWQWRVPAGVWADIDTEVASTFAAGTSVDPSSGLISQTPGSISVTHTKTGLTPGSTYELRFLWRRTGLGAEVYRSSGTLTADGTVS